MQRIVQLFGLGEEEPTRKLSVAPLTRKKNNRKPHDWPSSRDILHRPEKRSIKSQVASSADGN
jgi:hypothetical protein